MPDATPTQTTLNRVLTATKAAVRWLIDDWKIVLSVLGAAFTYFLLKRGLHPDQKLQVEMDAVTAQNQARQVSIDQGAEAAHAHVAQTYALTLATLNDQERQNATRLQSDPAALAGFLVRTGAGRASPSQPPKT